MPKGTRAKENTTPNKRSRKTTPEDGNGTQAAKPLTTSPAQTVKALAEPVLEEKIRLRAYEIYLERHGQGGSPEQDWLQAVEEIYSQSVA